LILNINFLKTITLNISIIVTRFRLKRGDIMRFSLRKKAMMASMYVGPVIIGLIIGAAAVYFLFWKGWLPCPSVVPVE
jgi:hypothetical protein